MSERDADYYLDGSIKLENCYEIKLIVSVRLQNFSNYPHVVREVSQDWEKIILIRTNLIYFIFSNLVV